MNITSYLDVLLDGAKYTPFRSHLRLIKKDPHDEQVLKIDVVGMRDDNSRVIGPYFIDGIMNGNVVIDFSKEQIRIVQRKEAKPILDLCDGAADIVVCNEMTCKCPLAVCRFLEDKVQTQ